MILKRILLQMTITVVFAFIYFNPISVLANCDQIEVYVELSSVNRDWVRVLLDSRKTLINEYIQSISFELTFGNVQNEPLGTEKIRYADEPPRGLDPDYYEFFVPHSQPLAASIINGKMIYICKRRGIEPFILPQELPSKRGELAPEGERKILGSLPEAQQSTTCLSNYTGVWRNKNPKLGFLQIIEITADSPNSLKIRSWLRCTNSGGEILRKNCVYWGEDKIFVPRLDRVIWRHHEKKKAVYGATKFPYSIAYDNLLKLDAEGNLTVYTDRLKGYSYFIRADK